MTKFLSPEFLSLPSNAALDKMVWRLGIWVPSTVALWALNSVIHQLSGTQRLAKLDPVHFAGWEGQEKRLLVLIY